MRLRREVVRSGIKRLGCIQETEFVTAAGFPANRKVDLDALTENKPANRLIRALAVAELVALIKPYDIQLIVPIPTGANHIGAHVARSMDVSVAYLRWIDKSPENKRIVPATPYDETLIGQFGRIALIDDVFTTGSSLMAAHAMRGMGDKVQVAGEVFDRSNGLNHDTLPFPIEAIISEPLPLWVEEA